MKKLRDVYVIGVGMTPFGRHEDKKLEDLGEAAIRDALADAGIGFDVIEQAICGHVGQGSGLVVIGKGHYAQIRREAGHDLIGGHRYQGSLSGQQRLFGSGVLPEQNGEPVVGDLEQSFQVGDIRSRGGQVRLGLGDVQCGDQSRVEAVRNQFQRLPLALDVGFTEIDPLFERPDVHVGQVAAVR